MREVTDDEVLQTMTRLGLEADNKIAFRSTRHLLKHKLPECCIVFQLRFITSFPLLNDAQMEAFLKDDGILGDLAVLNINFFSYHAWIRRIAKKAGFRIKRLNYTPCPSCVLSGNFIRIPPGCPCCRDREEYPDD